MKRKTKNLIGTITAVGCTALLVGLLGAFTNGFGDWDVKNWRNNLISEDKIDNDRVAVSIKGTYKEQDTNLYVFFNHPKLDEASVPYSWPGITPMSLLDEDEEVNSDYDYVTYDDGLFTFELTSLLPLEYDTFEDYYTSGGTIGVIISYTTEDGDLIQSKDMFLQESGIHNFSIPSENYGNCTHRITKYLIEEDEEKEEEKTSSSNSTTSSEESSSSVTE